MGGVGCRGCDAVGSGEIEGVVDCGDGVGESGALGGGCVVSGFPSPDATLYIDDVVLGLQDSFVRERVVGGVYRGAGGGLSDFLCKRS